MTERGYKWFFRTTPHDETFIANMMTFLDGRPEDQKTTRLAVVYENTDFGVNTLRAVQKLMGSKRTIVANIAYMAGTASVQAAVDTLAAAKPDVAIFASYAEEAIRFVRTMRHMGYFPPLLLANDAGFIDPHFLAEAGKDAQSVITRDVWASDLVRRKPVSTFVNEAFKQRTGKDLTGNSARALQAFWVLTDAINRAGSTHPEDIRMALAATDLSAPQVVMPWSGVKFDPKGQNVLGQGIMAELFGRAYRTIWASGDI